MNKKILFSSSLLISMTIAFTSCEDVNENIEHQEDEKQTPYVTKVLEYKPAPGQFVNTLPEYEDGDTQEDMNRKALESITNKNGDRAPVSLGGYGGYIIVGFDHTIENKKDLCDFRVLGNAFVNVPEDPDKDFFSGSCEPGIIMVAYDANKNGRPDDNEWFEIAGSAHKGNESWYEFAKEKGNDISIYKDFEIKYYKPENESEKPDNKYIKWETNKGKTTTGYIKKNMFHKQPYYPQWIKSNEISFKGTCLPQNGIDKNGNKDNYILYMFKYGYSDNTPNNYKEAAIDIDWAIDSKGNNANLKGVDFIKVYTGINQENGWLGECSTEFMGIEDLHLLEEKIFIDTNK